MRHTHGSFIVAAISLVAAPAFANITGTVRTTKTAVLETIDMSADAKCKQLAKETKDEHTLIRDGKVENVFVYVKNPPAGNYAPRGPVVLDQDGCRYKPRVFGIMVKQPLEIRNSDPTLHNVHAFAKRGEFNLAMPKKDQKSTRKFDKEQIMVPIRCDVHGWMTSFAGVLNHPFHATTGTDGRFDISTEGLADGSYEIAIWHEKLGEKVGKIAVSSGAATVDFDL